MKQPTKQVTAKLRITTILLIIESQFPATKTRSTFLIHILASRATSNYIDL